MDASPEQRANPEKPVLLGPTSLPVPRKDRPPRALRKRASLSDAFLHQTFAVRTSTLTDTLVRKMDASSVHAYMLNSFGVRASDADAPLTKFAGHSTFLMNEKGAWRNVWENDCDRPPTGCVTEFGHDIVVMTNGMELNGFLASELNSASAVLHRAPAMMTTNMLHKRDVPGIGEGVYQIGERFRYTEPKLSKKPKISESAIRAPEPEFRSWLHFIQRLSNGAVQTSREWMDAAVQESVAEVKALCGKGTASFGHPICSLGLNTGAGCHTDNDWLMATWLALGLVPIAFPEFKTCIFLRTGDVHSADAVSADLC